MEPVSVIVSSLAHYAAQKLGDKFLDKTGDDLYEKVKDKVRSLFDSNEDGLQALDILEKKPNLPGKRTSLKEELDGAEISQEDEVVALATKLLDHLKENDLLSGDDYKAIMQGDGSVVMGPGAVGAGAHSKVAAATAPGSSVTFTDESRTEHHTHYHGNEASQAKETSSSWRTRYLREIASETNILPWAPVTDTFASKTNHEPFGLSDVYTDLDTTDVQKIEKEEDYRELMAQRQEVERISAQATIDEHRCVLIMGDPGSGKSTFVKHVGYALAQAGLADDPTTWLETLDPWTHGALLPVWIELRSLVACVDSTNDNDDLVALFYSALQRQVAKPPLQGIGEDLEQYLQSREDSVVLLFDGLDEVPSMLRKKVVDLVNAVAERYQCHRVVVTCRPYAYLGQKYRLNGFHQVTLAAFSPEQIERFIRNWYDQHVTRKLLSLAGAESLRDRLIQAAQGNQLIELAERPLLLTVMAQLHTHKGQLPDDRTQLYQGAVDLLLERWENKSGEEEKGLMAFLGLPGLKINDVKDGLGEVAFQAHNQQAGRELGEITEGDLVNLLRRYFKDKWEISDKFVTYIRERAGLLIAHKPGAYKFPHLSFQEYLASCYLVAHKDYPGLPSDLVRKDMQRWREVFVLSCGVAARTGSLRTAILAVQSLCPEDLPTAQPQTVDDWEVPRIAGEALLEIGLVGVQRDEPGRKVHKRIQDWLLAAMRQNDVLTPVQRAAAGRVLAKLGDPRKEVIEAEHIELIDILKGPFTMGEGDKMFQCHMPYDYRISRFPITNAQFQEFVKTGGYQNASFWDEATAAGYWTVGKFKGKYDPEPREGPVLFREPFELDNHPVVGVTWYEALAFTQWLTTRLQETEKIPKDWVIKLPNEPEWERAARGTDGRTYPWGTKADTKMANYDDTGIGTTCAVGCFPQGESPDHIEEMSGNVWEWTRSMYKEYPYPAEKEGREELESLRVSKERTRVLRGGSFSYTGGYLRCASRIYGHPDHRNDFIGFRVVASPFSSP